MPTKWHYLETFEVARRDNEQANAYEWLAEKKEAVDLGGGAFYKPESTTGELYFVLKASCQKKFKHALLSLT